MISFDAELSLIAYLHHVCRFTLGVDTYETYDEQKHGPWEALRHTFVDGGDRFVGPKYGVVLVVVVVLHLSIHYPLSLISFSEFSYPSTYLSLISRSVCSYSITPDILSSLHSAASNT